VFGLGINGPQDEWDKGGFMVRVEYGRMRDGGMGLSKQVDANKEAYCRVITVDAVGILDT
jgi:hypothetical protein